MNAYEKCPVLETKSFTLRLVSEIDCAELYKCYNNKAALALMNDDNCDFGFFVESVEKMKETIKYWLDFYKQQCFIRFSIIKKSTGHAVGTIEGFGGEIGVFRLDIASDFEKRDLLCELFDLAKKNFRKIFGNDFIVTKAIPQAIERRAALEQNGWEYIEKFREYENYYQVKAD